MWWEKSSCVMCICECAFVSLYICAQSCPFFTSPWTVASQVPLSMGLSQQEYWSELPFPPPGELPDPGIKPESPVLAGGFFTTEQPGKKTRINKETVRQSRKDLVEVGYH